MGIEWHSIEKDGFPKEEGYYLVTLQWFNLPKCIYVVRFSNNLFNVDNYDFVEYEDKEKSGFYEYDPEFGYHEIENIIAWVKVEPYKEV